MTSRDKTVSFNTLGLGLGIGGGWTLSVGLLAFLSANSNVNSNASSKNEKTQKIWDAVSLVLGLAGIAMLTASLVIHEGLKEELGTDIGTIVGQLQRKESLSNSVNEPAVLAGIGAALIASGLIWGMIALRRERFDRWKWQPVVMFSVGLIMWAFSSSCENNAISSMNAMRLAWTLPGICLILTSLYALPYSIHHGFEMYTVPACLTGWLVVSIGGAYIGRT